MPCGPSRFTAREIGHCGCSRAYTTCFERRVMMLNTMTVNDIIRLYPESVEVFNRLGIDACCGGDIPLPEAARFAGHEPGEVEREIERCVAEAA